MPERTEANPPVNRDKNATHMDPYKKRKQPTKAPSKQHKTCFGEEGTNSNRSKEEGNNHLEGGDVSRGRVTTDQTCKLKLK